MININRYVQYSTVQSYLYSSISWFLFFTLLCRPSCLCVLLFHTQEIGSEAQADNALLVKQALHLVEDAMEGVQFPAGSKGVTRAGEFVYALFGHAGITFDTALVRNMKN